jgi:putative phosphoribosyl transferase
VGVAVPRLQLGRPVDRLGRDVLQIASYPFRRHAFTLKTTSPREKWPARVRPVVVHRSARHMDCMTVRGPLGISTPGLEQRRVSVPAGGVSLAATMCIPPRAEGAVLFPHASSVAGEIPLEISRQLAAAGLATLALTTATEEEGAAGSPDAAGIADRLIASLFWALREQVLDALPFGLFGFAETVDPVLLAAGTISEIVRAIVLAGGRPRVDADRLGRIEAPTLMIVATRDKESVTQSTSAIAELHVEKKLAAVGGVDDLSARDTTSHVAVRASRWFEKYLRPGSSLSQHTSSILPKHRNARS